MVQPIPDISPDVVYINAWFTDNQQPEVFWQLNQQCGTISLIEARARAQALFQAAGYAEGEAAIVKGILTMHMEALKGKGFGGQVQTLKRSVELDALTMAAQLRRFLQQERSPLLEGIEVIFGLKTRKALINVAWYGEQCQWETTQAVEHAIGLIEAAEGAESDAFFRWFLIDKVGIKPKETCAMIREFQVFRQRRQLEDLFKEGNF